MRTKEGFELQLAVAMGGWAAVMIELNGTHDTGIRSDFKQATKMAIEMVAIYGMSPLGFVSLIENLMMIAMAVWMMAG